MVIHAKNVRVEVGNIPKKRKEGVIYFSDFEEMNKVLNPRRMELLNIIKQRKPESIYELANMAERDQGNVTKDINILSKYGFVHIQKKKEGNRFKSEPIFESEGIEMIIKIGAGAFGFAKEAIEKVSDEFRDENLNKNKEFTKNTIRKGMRPMKNIAKKIAEELDIVTK